MIKVVLQPTLGSDVWSWSVTNNGWTIDEGSEQGYRAAAEKARRCVTLLREVGQSGVTELRKSA
jgi:hypothetical protein